MSTSKRVRKLTHNFALPPSPSAPPALIQTSLLQVGMRVRKSVSQGYHHQRTRGIPKSETKVFDEEMDVAIETERSVSVFGGKWRPTSSSGSRRKRGLEHEDEVPSSTAASPCFSLPNSLLLPTTTTAATFTTQYRPPNDPPPFPSSFATATDTVSATTGPALRPILQPQSRSRVRAFRHYYQQPLDSREVGQQRAQGKAGQHLAKQGLEKEFGVETMEWAPSEPDFGEAEFLVERNGDCGGGQVVE